MINTNNKSVQIKRGEIWLVDFGKSDKVTSKQLGIRPCIVFQNSSACMFSPVVTVIPLSTNIKKCKLPTHTLLHSEKDGVIKPSFAMAEQIQTLDKSDLIKKLSITSNETIQKVEYAVMVQLGLVTQQINRKVV